MSVCYQVTPITFEGTVSYEHISRLNVCSIQYGIHIQAKA